MIGHAVLWGYFLTLQWIANAAKPEIVPMPPITVVYGKTERDDCEDARTWFASNKPELAVSDCLPQFAPLMDDETIPVAGAKSHRTPHASRLAHHTMHYRRHRA